MRTSAAVKHFKKRIRIAEQLKITRAAVYQWGDIVPLASAYELERLTGGKLKVDHALYQRGRPIESGARA